MIIYFLWASLPDSNIFQINSENTSFLILDTDPRGEKKALWGVHIGCSGNTLSKISVHIAYVSEIGCLLICLGLPNWVRLFLVSPNRNISPAVMLHKIQRDNFFHYHAVGWWTHLPLSLSFSIGGNAAALHRSRNMMLCSKQEVEGRLIFSDKVRVFWMDFPKNL